MFYVYHVINVVNLRNVVNVMPSFAFTRFSLGGGEKSAVVDATNDDGDVFFHTEWQEVIERSLFKQCVAAGKQEAVEQAAARA